MPAKREDRSYATVTEALQRQTVDDLKDLAQLVSGDRKPTRKDDLIAFIQKHLEGENLRKLWNQLDELQQAAVAEVVHSPDTIFPAERFLAKYGDEPTWSETSVSGYRYSKDPSKLCLFFYSYGYSYGYSSEMLMPEELKQRLKVFVPPPKPVTLETLQEPPKVFQRRWKEYASSSKGVEMVQGLEEVLLVQRSMEAEASHDLLSMLRLIVSGKVVVSDKTHYPNSATLGAIAPLLQGGDYYDDDENIGAIKAFAWPLMIQAAGLAELSGKRLQLTPTGQKALTEPPYKTLRAIWKKWLKTKLLDELRRVESIKGQTGKGQRSLTAVEKRRTVIVNALTKCPVGEWVAIDKFFRYMRAADYDFEVSRNPENLSLENLSYYYEEEGEDNEVWRILQGSYILVLLFEYAATLGIVDVAYIHPSETRQDYYRTSGLFLSDFFSRYDGLVNFCLTPLGAYCLELTNKYEPPKAKARSVLRVLPNLEIAATGEALAPGEVLLLEIYAEKVSDAVWRLTRDRLLNAIASGHTLSELQQFLLNLSGQSLPKTVIQFLTDIEARTNSLIDKGMARVIECSDAALAALIANDSRTKPFCALRGDRTLLVFSESETKFRNALQKLGYSLPK